MRLILATQNLNQRSVWHAGLDLVELNKKRVPLPRLSRFPATYVIYDQFMERSTYLTLIAFINAFMM
jgi:hypothetical protein